MLRIHSDPRHDVGLRTVPCSLTYMSEANKREDAQVVEQPEEKVCSGC